MDKTLAASSSPKEDELGYNNFQRIDPFFQEIVGRIQHTIWRMTSAPHMQISSHVDRISLLPNVQGSYASLTAL